MPGSIDILVAALPTCQDAYTEILDYSQRPFWRPIDLYYLLAKLRED